MSWNPNLVVSGVPGLGISIPVRDGEESSGSRNRRRSLKDEAYWAGTSAPATYKLDVRRRLRDLKNRRKEKKKEKSSSSVGGRDSSSVASSEASTSECSCSCAATPAAATAATAAVPLSSSWGPQAQSLQSLSQLRKLDLPRVASPANDLSSNHHHQRLRRSSLARSATTRQNHCHSATSSTSSTGVGAVAPAQSRLRTRHHQPLSHHSSVPPPPPPPHPHKQKSSPQLTVVSAQVHWSDARTIRKASAPPVRTTTTTAVAETAKRSLRRQSCHWDRLAREHQLKQLQQLHQGYSSEHELAANHGGAGGSPCPARKRASVGSRRAYFDQRFPHLSAILRSSEAATGSGGDCGPTSLPVGFEQVRRPPLPAPPKKSDKSIKSSGSSSSSSDSNSDGDSDDESESVKPASVNKSHYERLKQGRRKEEEEEKETGGDGRCSSPEFYKHTFKKRSLITQTPNNSSGSFYPQSQEEDTFGSVDLPRVPSVPSAASSSSLFKVLNDRDGDYAYAYDCSMSPAFIIRYNAEEEAKLRASNNGENIYEEICEVKEKFRSCDEDDGGEEEEESKRKKSNNLSSSNTSSSEESSAKSSLQADSGVHETSNNSNGNTNFSSRKFSSDTLDLGPRSLMMISRNRRRRRRRRMSEESLTSFDKKEEEVDDDDEDWSTETKSRMSRLRAARSLPISGGGGEEEEEEEERDKDSGIQDVGQNNQNQQQQQQQQQQKEKRRRSLSKIRGLKFGFPRGQSASSLQSKAMEKEKGEGGGESGSHKSSSPHVRRLQSFDSKLVAKREKRKEEEKARKPSWLRKYSQALLKSLGSSGGGGGGSAAKDDLEVTPDDDSSNLRRFQRTRLTGRWEDLHSYHNNLRDWD